MSHGIIEESYEMMPGGGVRWSELNPATGIRTICTLTDDTLVRETYHLYTDLMVDANAEQQSNSIGSRWGDGQIYARVPMNLAYSGYLGEATAAGDRKAMAKWFNDSDNRAFRTFGGTI